MSDVDGFKAASTAGNGKTSSDVDSDNIIDKSTADRIDVKTPRNIDFNDTKATKITDVDNEMSTEIVSVTQLQMSPMQQLKSVWYIAVIVLTPILLMPMPIAIGTQEAKCAFVICIMAVYWVTEALPIPVTSLLPVFLLPMLGIMSAKETSATYLNDTSVLFIGGLILAVAIEHWNLHRRLALSIMMVVGSEPKCLMFGMMGVTWFLSMWISNTAATTLMMPIVQAMLNELDETRHNHESDLQDHKEIERQEQTARSKSRKRRRDNAEKQIQMRKAMALSIAYASNAGGIACLIGTPPNLFLLSESQRIFASVGLSSPITFASWFVYGAPVSLILLIFLWIWLQIYFFRCRDGCDCIFNTHNKVASELRSQRVKTYIIDEFRQCGPITYPEGNIIVFFLILAFLWTTRDMSTLGGWGSWFQNKYVSDSTPAILAAVLMFLLPSQLPDIFSRKKREDCNSKPLTPLLDWKTVNDKMPWSVYLLLGGGFAIAKAATVSKLNDWVGNKLIVFVDLDPWLMVTIICYIVTFVTEVTSNTAVAMLVLPVLYEMALTLKVNPLLFMFPATLTSSFAFMLPVATPPNAIVFSYGTLRVVDMMKCGFVINILSVPLLVLATATWGNAFFRLDVIPPEFLYNTTSTTVAPQKG